MSSPFKLLFLGTGTSAGVPMIGCDCPVCRSSDPKNHRDRASVYLSVGDMRVLVDTSPDLRMQALRNKIRRVDFILITHAHVDHLFGLDEVRRFNTIQGDEPLPIYAGAPTLADIHRIFDYIFHPALKGTYRPKLELHETTGSFTLAKNGTTLAVSPFLVHHGKTFTQGYRFDYEGRALAYMPDCHELDDPDEPALKGLDVLILDTLRYRPHPTHLSLDESLALIERFKPRRAYMTHLCHDFDHATLIEDLRQRGLDGIAPAYDGMEIEI